MKRRRNRFPVKYILLIMTVGCAVVIAMSIRFSYSSATAVNSVASYFIVPMQKGINNLCSAISGIGENMRTRAALEQENEELKDRVEVLEWELLQNQVDQVELDNLKELYDMDQAYSDYDKLAASVIGKDSGNWFSVFVVDKGSKDGVEKGMNVLANGALAGVVTDVGTTYCEVRSIIDDESNVSAMTLTSSDYCMVSGSLETMNSDVMIDFSDMKAENCEAKSGDLLVTSAISDVYHEGIPIGYISDLSLESDKLTYSGTVNTIADFSDIRDVFIILDVKTTTE